MGAQLKILAIAVLVWLKVTFMPNVPHYSILSLYEKKTPKNLHMGGYSSIGRIGHVFGGNAEQERHTADFQSGTLFWDYSDT
jgi:hypothetical protein